MFGHDSLRLAHDLPKQRLRYRERSGWQSMRFRRGLFVVIFIDHPIFLHFFFKPLFIAIELFFQSLFFIVIQHFFQQIVFTVIEHFFPLFLIIKFARVLLRDDSGYEPMPVRPVLYGLLFEVQRTVQQLDYEFKRFKRILLRDDSGSECVCDGRLQRHAEDV